MRRSTLILALVCVATLAGAPPDRKDLEYAHPGASTLLDLHVHGNNDDQVSYEQSPAMCEAMHKVGAGCEPIAIENGGHGICAPYSLFC